MWEKVLRTFHYKCLMTHFSKDFGDQFGNQLKQNRVQKDLWFWCYYFKRWLYNYNNHVIENAEEITVTIGDETTEYKCKINWA